MATILYAGVLGLMYLWMTYRVIRGRITNRISMGVGPNNEILSVVSGHNNFSNYAFLFLLFLFLFESVVTPPTYLVHIVACVFCLGRFLHFMAFNKKKMNFLIRRAGMVMTLFPIMVLSVTFIVTYLKGAF